MAKDSDFGGIVSAYREQIKEMRKQIDSADTINELIADVFVQRARARLGELNNAKNKEVVSRLLGNIYARSTKNGVQIIIRQDPEGLMTFLEYGTGVLGGMSPHPEAEEVGWIYAGNSGTSDAWRSVYGRLGWFFRTSSPNVYIDNNDSDRRDGGTLVFTQGIKPIRYIYNTRIEIENLIIQADGDYVKLRESLNKLNGAPMGLKEQRRLLYG